MHGACRFDLSQLGPFESGIPAVRGLPVQRTPGAVPCQATKQGVPQDRHQRRQGNCEVQTKGGEEERTVHGANRSKDRTATGRKA